MGNCANNGGKWIRPEKRRAIYLRDKLTCTYCGRDLMGDMKNTTLDHVTPQEFGGTNHESNLVLACKTCNSVKGSKSKGEFLSSLEKRGIDTSDIANRIRRRTRRKLKGYYKEVS